MIARFLPRFRRAYRFLKALEARESWTRGEIEAYQLERLNAVWAHAVAHVPHYRELAARRRLPARFESLQQYRACVPILPKSEVRDNPAAFLSARAARGGWQRTSGSTGTPMQVYWGTEAYRRSLCCRYRYYQAWGLDIFDRTVFLWGRGASMAPGLAGRWNRLRQPLEDRLRRRLRLSAYCVGRADLRQHLERMAAFRPRSVYGYSQSAYLLALEAEAAGFACDSLRLLTLTSEPAFPHIVRTVERAFRVPATVEYGAVEVGLIAQEWPDRTLRIREDMVLLETLPREDGRFDLVVSVLENPSFPLLRYAIGDVTDAPLEQPSRGFARMKNVVGRTCDFILTCSGRYLHFTRLEALIKYSAGFARQYAARQHADGSLSMQLVVDDPGASRDLAELKRALYDLTEGYPVEVELVSSIPQTAAGKHRLIVSDLIDPATGLPRAALAAPSSGRGEGDATCLRTCGEPLDAPNLPGG